MLLELCVVVRHLLRELVVVTFLKASHSGLKALFENVLLAGNELLTTFPVGVINDAGQLRFKIL